MFSQVYDWLCHLVTFIANSFGTKKWPSNKANHTCENMQ